MTVEERKEKARTFYLWVAIIIMAVFTLVKVLGCIGLGDMGVALIYLFGNTVISAIIIFTARIGDAFKTRLIMLSLPSALLVGFGLIFGIASAATTRSTNSRSVDRLEHAVEIGLNDEISFLLERNEYEEEDLNGALYAVVEADNPAAVFLLVEAGADKNRYNGMLLLSVAVHSASPETARALLDTGADVMATDDNGETPLHIAAEELSADFLRLFLEAGADPNVQDSTGKTALHRVGMGRSSDSAEETEIVGILLDAGADPAVYDHRGFPPANYVDSAALALLEERGCRKIQTYRNGMSELHQAVEANHVSEVRRLLEEGYVPVDIRDDYGRTPLMYAAQDGYLELTRMLVDAGADVNAISEFETTPLIGAASSGSTSIGRILLYQGANINPQGLETSPLSVAIWREHPDFVRLLLYHGVVVDVTAEEALTECKDTEISAMVRIRMEQNTK